jgi:voltage-gated potassium channel
MPAGIIASGFIEQLKQRDFIVTWQLVAQVPLFRRLTAARIANVAMMLKPLRFEAGAVVYKRGEQVGGMYFVVSGDLSVEVPGRPVTIRSGSFFGEMGLLEGGIHSATARTLTPCELLHLGVDDFRQLVANAPDLADEIRRVADERRRDNESSTVGQRPA